MTENFTISKLTARVFHSVIFIPDSFVELFAFGKIDLFDFPKRVVQLLSFFSFYPRNCHRLIGDLSWILPRLVFTKNFFELSNSKNFLRIVLNCGKLSKNKKNSNRASKLHHLYIYFFQHLHF